jgi:1,4-dihydroxy-2-naphthoate octaprenyltransferase
MNSIYLYGMTTTQAWIKAVRLRTLPLSLSGIIIGSFIAKFNGFWDTRIFSLAMLTTILFQILSNLANDLGDSLKGTDNTQRIGPVRAVQSGVISKKQMTIAVVLTSLLSLLSASYLILLGTTQLPSEMRWFYAALAVTCILAAITYTIGKNAYGYLGLGDIMVFLFFGWVSVLGVYPLFAKELDWLLLLPASCIGLLSAAVLNLNNMRDRVNDEQSGKRTLVVKMGGDAAKIYHTLLILGGLTCLGSYIFLINHPMAFIGLLPSVLLIIHLRKVAATTDAKTFDPELKKVALSTFFIAILTAVGLMM